MREIPILFSGPMVRAILEGRKTVTRRLPAGDAAHLNADPDRWRCVRPLLEAEPIRDGGVMQFPGADYRSWITLAHPAGLGDGDWFVFGAPWGVGDRLWVRETWTETTNVESDPDWPLRPHVDCDPEYTADQDGVLYSAVIYRAARWASRLTLEVVSVRVERLQEITNDDARAEGVKPYINGEGFITHHELESDGWAGRERAYRNGFEVTWDALNGKRATWDSNPWVWRVEFKRVAP